MATLHAAQALSLENRYSTVLEDLGFTLYQASTILCVDVTRSVSINWHSKIREIKSELQIDFNSLKFFLPNFLWSLFAKLFTAKIIYYMVSSYL